MTKTKKTKPEMRRRNNPVMKSVESVLGREETLWWERFVKEAYVLSRELKSEGTMDGESGMSTKGDVGGAGKGKSVTQRLE